MSESSEVYLPEDELRECEEIIGRTMHAMFCEVGNALARIKAGKLWTLGDYKSFGAYCVERWAIQERHADRFIESSDAYQALRGKARVDTLPTNERQVRELLRLRSPDDRAHIWDQVAAAALPARLPSAGEVRRAVNKFAAQEPERFQKVRPVRVKQPRSDAAPKEAVPCDGLGHPVPSGLIPAWEAIGRMQAAIAGIKVALSEIKGLAGAPGAAHLPSAEIITELETARRAIAAAMPYAPLPEKAKGHIDAKYIRAGFLTKAQWETLPTELKKQKK